MSLLRPPRSLRVRLVVALLSLAAAVLLLLGVVVYAMSHGSALDRTDATLRAVQQRVAAQVRAAEPLGEGLAGQARALGATDYFIEIHRPNGTVVPLAARLRDPDVPPPELPDELAGVTGEPATVGSVDGSGDYRMLVRRLPRDRGLLVVAVPLDDVQASLRRLLAVEVVGSATALVLLGALGSAVVRRGLRPLEDMAQDADAITAGDTHRRVQVAAPGSEVGRLGLALNTMLDRMEGAFATERAAQERLRRFVADASHELRTPVTAVLGYADLHRQGAVREPAEVEHAMDRISHEALRMQRLVDDLLLLARLDEERTPERRPVDIALLAERAVSSHQAVDPDRTVELRTVPDAVVIGDEDQLRRVLDNLLGNVRVHTPPGAPALVEVSRHDGEVVVEVADRGPGIPPEALSQVFDRFYRADTSRSRSLGGTGLGLSIVAAVASAHGGRVDVRSDPGTGTTVRLALPGGGV